MADISQISVNSTTYDIKDAGARASISGAAADAESAVQTASGTYTGRSLETTFAAEISAAGNVWAWLKSRARAGNYTGIRIGDWADVLLTTGATVRYRVAAFDPYYRCSATLIGRHVVMVPDAPVVVVDESFATSDGNICWCAANDNNGTEEQQHPYLASRLHQWELESYYPTLPAELKAAILPHTMMLEKRYSGSGKVTESTGCAWVSLGEVWSLSEVEVAGYPVSGTQFFSCAADVHFPLFQSGARNRLAGDRKYWWLRNVCAGSNVNIAYVSYSGDLGRIGPSSVAIRPRPCFLIG